MDQVRQIVKVLYLFLCYVVFVVVFLFIYLFGCIIFFSDNCFFLLCYYFLFS